MIGLKKICILLPAHFSARMGGAEYQVKMIMDSLCKKDGYSISYLCRHVAPGYEPEGYHVRQIGGPTSMRKYGFFCDTRTLYKTLQETNPQIIYQRVGCAYTGIAAYYAKRFGAKLIWHISIDNDVTPFTRRHEKNIFKDVIDRFFLNYGIRNSHIIIGQTQHQSNLLKKNFGRKCDEIIYNGHPVPSRCPKKQAQPCVLWIGKLNPVKQPEIFVRLAREVGRVRNISFLMFGRARSAKCFTRFSQKVKHVPNLEYLGQVSQDEVNQRLTQGHILVNTSRYEGFPNTFIQSWMRNVPVVTLNVDPDGILTREKIGFHSRTFEQLVRDVTLLTENTTLREEMGARAHRYAIDNHNAEKMVEKVTSLFH